jgi:hypothetical protein
VALALLLVGLAPLALLSYQLVQENRAALTMQVLRTHAVAARTAADRTAAFLAPLRSLAAAVAASPEIAADPRSPASRALLAGLLEGRDSVAAIVLRSADGAEFIRAQRRDLGRVVDAALAAPATGPIARVRAADETWVRVSGPLAGGARVDVVASAAPLGDVVRTEEIGEEAALAIADASGAVVAASDPAVGLPSFPSRLVAAARTGVVSGSGRFEGANGGEVLGAWAPVPASDWFVLSRQPVSLAEAVARRLRQRSLLAVGLSVLLTAGLSAVAYRSVVRPIRGLVEAQRRVLGSTVPLAGAGNEISQLRESFRVLERRIRDQQDLGQVFLGRYQVVGVLGEGGMGTVFRGWDPKLQRPVALKTLRLGDGAPEDTRTRMVSQLLQEAVTVARLSHANIVSVFDVEDAPGAAFIAMELVDGTTLARLLRKMRVLPVAAAVPLGASIARGLEAAHAHGIVHRDVKPGNVLLGRDGSIKVADFGVAELMSSLARKEHLTFGTPGFLPPESVRGEGYDKAGDLFALGAVMYRCLTGHPAIPGKDPAEIMRNTLAGATPMDRWSVPVPEDVEALVMGLLAPKREQRSRTAGQVAEALERMAAGHGWRWTLAGNESDDDASDDARIHAGLVPTLHPRGKPRGGS